MSWRDQVGQPAAFRGVKFFIDSSERSGGRRVVKHEYPFKDEPFTEDMGRQSRPFNVEGFVIGENYFNDRDALLEALETDGSGELVHPYYGTRRVVVLNFSFRESTSEGGMARFRIEFGETPVAPTQPTAVVDPISTVQGSASLANAAVGAKFLTAYNPGALLSSVTGAITNAAARIDKAVRTIQMGEQALATLKHSLSALTTSVSTLAGTPGALLASLQSLVAQVPSEVAFALYNFDPGIRPPATTSNRIREQENFDACQRVIQRLAAIRAAQLAPTLVYDNFEAAVAARDNVTALLDEQAELAADDTYPALLQLRADVVEGVPGPDSDIPRLLTNTPPTTVPSLVLAHRIYGNLDLELDLVARNKIQNPALITGGRPLEVLSA